MDKEVIVKLVENKGIATNECQKVVGSLEALYAIADFWERYPGEIQLIATNELLDYIESKDFNKEQIEAFKEGLGKIPLFFQKCLDERQRIEASKLK